MSGHAETAGAAVRGPRRLSRPEHCLSRSGISDNALKVMYRLERAGYLSYMVGGAVRDLLLGRRPKDFDVATNARPEEIRRLFRNSRIIGRRFRLVHLLFRDEVVEVSTFRSSPEPPEAPNEAEGWEHSEDVAEETVEPEVESMYGSPDQDALRRDFTVNALFYDIADFSIVDYVGGLDDLEQRVLRTIGEPSVRFAEDPVRMLRALEYSVRLDFRLDERTAAAIAAGHGAITEAAPARLAYELLETLRSGHAAGIIDAWQRVGLLGEAFPALAGDHQQRLDLLAAVDQRHRLGATFADATLVGALFLPQFLDLLTELDVPDGRLNRGLLLEQLTTLLDEAGSRVHLSNHVVHQMGQAMFALAKMRRPPERGRQVVKLARQSYFAVAWDLLSLASSAGLAEREVVQAWGRAVERFRRGDNVEVEPTPSADAAPAPGRRRRRPRRRRRA